MGLFDDIQSEVKAIFKDQWTTRDGAVVPAPSDIKLSNDAVRFERATVLYADLDGSTNMVDTKKWYFAAEVYKAYLHAAAKIIRSMGGEITAYDGDRIMALFIGDSQTSDAAKCALKLNFVIAKIINPSLKAQYPNSTFVVKQVIGIDTSSIHAVRIGVRGGNDIVWVGRAANYAAKLTSLSNGKVWLTDAAFKKLNEATKYSSGADNKLMWDAFYWNTMNKQTIWKSDWTWTVT